MRMCVGCRQMKPKRELIRIVKSTGDIAEVDPTGKKNGRGAYICADGSCLETARKQKRLDRALGCEVRGEVYTAIQEGRPGPDGQ
ncbi:MAG TPA: DUF448 domain-containing protein [Clostridiales bacterium]|nr:DUF448 domain-containing protein [Clostridiales bacterium]